jgi:acyl-CoA synthetase (AMP-forming)/AMP-acid ligase II
LRNRLRDFPRFGAGARKLGSIDVHEPGGIAKKYERRIVDESGNNLPQGAIGEIVYRGPCMFSGYWNDSVKTLETMREGWIYSGDRRPSFHSGL